MGVPRTWQLCDSPSMSLLSQDGIVIPMDMVLATVKPERVPENKSRGGNSNLISTQQQLLALLRLLLLLPWLIGGGTSVTRLVHLLKKYLDTTPSHCANQIMQLRQTFLTLM